MIKIEENLYTLYQRTNYLDRETVILKNTTIKEYDIHDCGFSILKKEKMLSNQQVQYINSLKNKFDKNYYIGLLCQKNKKLSDCINENLIEIRKEFQISNDIRDSEILSIKRDAIFLRQKEIKNLFIQGVEFKQKNVYDSFIVLNKIEFYLNNQAKDISIKGLGSNFKNDFLNDLKSLILFIGNKKECIRQIEMYKDKYISRYLDIEKYRECSNRTNLFRVTKDNLTYLYNFYNDKYDLDINYNYMTFLLPLYKIIIQS